MASLPKQFNGLETLEPKVTDEGKNQLQKGIIKEPAKTEKLVFFRCLGSERVILDGLRGVSKFPVKR